MNAWGKEVVSQSVAKKSSIMPLEAVDGDETYSSRRPSDVAADRNAHGDAGYLHSRPL